MSSEHRLVLIVEDSDECAAMLEIALTAIPGTALRWARSAEEALQTVASTPVSAVVTDLHLPGMDGLELIQHLRSDRHTAAIPILVVSGDSDRATPNRVSAAGATAFFGKPFSPAAVRKKLEALLNEH